MKISKKYRKILRLTNNILFEIKSLGKKVISSKFYSESLNLILVTTVSTIIATIISTYAINVENKKNIINAQREKLLYDLQTICIGCNKEWMDSVFGIPVFTSTDQYTIEEVYITNIALIRAFFGIEDNSCKMFFITQTTPETIPFMPTIRNCYYNELGEKSLGTLSYEQIKYYNMANLFVAYGFYTNGSGRAFYGEGYNCYGGFYQDIYFASLDYGENNPLYMMNDILGEDITEESLDYYESLPDNELNNYHLFLSERSKFYPNTYGVSSLDQDYSFDKLMDYNTFDSMQTAYR